MIFTEIVANVAEALNVSTSTATTRIGTFVNKRYKRVTASIGLDMTRRTTITVAFTLGVRDLVCDTLEKVISVQDTTSGPRSITLEEISYEEMIEEVPRTDRPTKFAVKTTAAHSVTLYTNFTPQAAFTVQVEGYARAGTLSGAQEPAFAESYHDILEFGAKADELRKMEKVALARDAENDFERRLGELRYFIAESAHQDIVQGKTAGTSMAGGSGGGSTSITGASSYTQTGLITFDRDPLAPFAVTSGSAKVDNLDADLLDGHDSTYFAVAGAGVTEASITFTDITTNNVTSTKHGFAPKSPASATQFLNGAATPAWAAVKDSDLAVTDITTNNFTTGLHGFVPKSTAADLAKFLRADGSWAEAFPQITQGRLTLTTATPVTTADVTGAATVYFTPYGGNRIAVYNGTYWKLYAFTEISLGLGTITNDLPYDVFIYDNAGTLTLEFLAWTSKTARATALVLQDGVLVKTGATTRKYLGTFHTTATTTTEDSFAKRLLWNNYNRVLRPMRNATETTDTWNYTIATLRQANANTANQIACVIGWAEEMLDIAVQATVISNSAYVTVGIGEDSTTTNATGFFAGAISSTFGVRAPIMASLKKIPAVGYHFYAWLEQSQAAGTNSWYGDDGTAANVQSGIHGTIRN